MKIQPINTKTCPSCGRSFTCTGDEDCWCEKIRINKKELLLIMNKYDDCICPDCLSSFQEK